MFPSNNSPAPEPENTYGSLSTAINRAGTALVLSSLYYATEVVLSLVEAGQDPVAVAVKGLGKATLITSSTFAVSLTGATAFFLFRKAQQMRNAIPAYVGRDHSVNAVAQQVSSTANSNS